jgi:hypothetical protein
MDFSKKYIKMCEKAEEIQREWKPQLGDFVYGITDDEGNLAVTVVMEATTGWTSIRVVDIYNSDKMPYDDFQMFQLTWLPRIDQLIEMVLTYRCGDVTPHNCDKGECYTPPIPDYIMLFKEFNWWFKVNHKGIIDSMEQLWLTFVMWKRYKKVWDNEKEEWIKNESSSN